MNVHVELKLDKQNKVTKESLSAVSKRLAKIFEDTEGKVLAMLASRMCRRGEVIHVKLELDLLIGVHPE